MSSLLEILGRAMTFDTADLIRHWLNAARLSDSDPARQQQLDRIVELMGAKKTEAAAEQLRLYLFDTPSCARGRLAAAAICMSQSRISDAIEELNSVYLRQPSNTMALYALGYCYERLGKEAQAVEFYQDCLKFKNYLQLPRQRLAAIYFKNGQLAKTTIEYELLKDEYPNDVSSLVTLGHLHIAGAEYDKAAETFDTAILIHPDNFNTTDDDMDQLIADGEFYEAAGQLEHLLAEQPENAGLILKYADVLTKLGAASQAVLQYEQALRICPDFLEATIKLGTQYLHMGELRGAALQFNNAVEINDRIVDAYVGLAITRKLAGDFSEALATLSLAAAIDANTPLLFAQTAALQFKARFATQLSSDDTEDSARLIDAAILAHHRQIALRPQNPDLHYRLAILMMNAARLDDATSLLRAALEINPTYSRARNKLAVCLFETDRKDEAINQLIGPECLDKNTLELHYKVALLYCDKVKFASSLLNLDRLLESNFAGTDPAVNISIVLQNLGLLDRATIMWDNLTETADLAARADQLF